MRLLLYNIRYGTGHKNGYHLPLPFAGFFKRTTVNLQRIINFIASVNPDIVEFDASCFDGCYVTGDVTEAYLARLEGQRNGDIPMTPAPATRQLDLNLAAS